MIYLFFFFYFHGRSNDSIVEMIDYCKKNNEIPSCNKEDYFKQRKESMYIDASKDSDFI